MMKLTIRLFCIAAILTATPAVADIEAARAAYAAEDFEKAARLVRPLSEAGDAEALNLLGLMHHYGQGVAEDDQAAFALFGKAAQAGLAEAQYNLANMYMYDYGVPAQTQDPEREAVRLYIESAVAGYAEAQYTLGLLLLAGSIVIQDPEEAMVWIRRAAEQGHEAAQDYVDSQSGN